MDDEVVILRIKVACYFIRGMPGEPDWSKVLKHLYEREGVHHLTFDDDSKVSLDKKKELRNEIGSVLDLEANGDKELRALCNHLERINLVKVVSDSNWAEIRLTKAGFEVAHERQLAKRQDWTNRLLVVLTAALAMAAVIQAQTAWFQLGGAQQTALTLTAVVFASALLGGLWIIKP